jgi:hypothetical protein
MSGQEKILSKQYKITSDAKYDNSQFDLWRRAWGHNFQPLALNFIKLFWGTVLRL